MNDTTTVSTRGLTKHCGEIRAMGGVDLTVPARDVYRLLGPKLRRQDERDRRVAEGQCSWRLTVLAALLSAV